MAYIPYTDFTVPDYSVKQEEAGRKNLFDMPLRKKEEILEVECEEIPNEEEDYDPYKEAQAQEMGMIKTTVFVLLVLLFLWIIKKFSK